MPSSKFSSLCCSVAKSCPTLWDPMDSSMPPDSQASLSFTISQRLLKLLSIELVMPSNRLILCRPLLLLPSIFPSIGIFSSELALCIRWPKYWSFSFSISPSSEYSELISFRIDWFDLLAVQVTLKSLLHHHSSKASIIWQKKPPKQMAENKSPGLSEGPRAPGLRISSSSRPNKYRWALPYTSARGAVWPHCSPCPKTTTISSRGAGGYRLSREALLLLLPEMSWSCSRLESGAGVTQGFC